MANPYILILALLVPGAPAQAPKSYHFKAAATAKLDERVQDSTQEGWMVGARKFRVDSHVGQRTYITIGAGRDLWLLDPTKLTGQHRMLTAAEAASVANRTRIAGDELTGLLKQGAKKTGDDKLEGSICDVYRLKTRDGMQHTLWVLKGPERLTKRHLAVGTFKGAVGPGSPMGAHVIYRMVTYTWDSDKPIDPQVFAVPKGYRIVEAPKPAPPVYRPPAGGTKKK